MSVYLKGSGIKSDPFVIHNYEALVRWLSVDWLNPAGYYAVMCSDIDLKGYSQSLGVDLYGYLNGNGFSISNLNMSYPYNLRGQADYALQNVSLVDFKVYSPSAYFRPITVKSKINNVTIVGGVASKLTYDVFYSSVPGTEPVFINIVKNSSLSVTAVDGGSSGCSSFNGSTPDGWLDANSVSDPYSRLNFPSLTALPSIWAVDGASIPRLIKGDTSLLTSAYAVKGVTRIGGVAKKRMCSSLSCVDFNLISKRYSNENGEYIINCGLYSDFVYVVHSDDYGSKFTQSKAYSLGDIIHPSVPNGYRYICTTAGTSAATEPVSWPTTGTLITGSAIFTPAPVYKPETMLVVPVLIDLVTGLPV